MWGVVGYVGYGGVWYSFASLRLVTYGRVFINTYHSYPKHTLWEFENILPQTQVLMVGCTVMVKRKQLGR